MYQVRSQLFSCSATHTRSVLSACVRESTDDALLGKKQFKEYLESISTRIKAVEDFIELIRPTIQHQVVPLQVLPPSSSSSIIPTPRAHKTDLSFDFSGCVWTNSYRSRYSSSRSIIRNFFRWSSEYEPPSLPLCSPSLSSKLTIPNE